MARRIGVAVTMAMDGASLAAGPASAGGWATVGLDSVPDGVRAGEPWGGPPDDPPARPNPTRGCATRAHDRASLIALVDFLLAAGGEG
jgi:hypothetical protein